jgi:hypothetical protein
MILTPRAAMLRPAIAAVAPRCVGFGFTPFPTMELSHTGTADLSERLKRQYLQSTHLWR